MWVGIWDCLTSQQVVDIVRYQISKGKCLAEISGLIFDHCLSPDSDNGHSTGQDNMTMILVGLLGNRTKKEWYAWITKRVKKGHGYETPSALPELYPPQRLASFKARKESFEARERERAQGTSEGDKSKEMRPQEDSRTDGYKDGGEGDKGGGGRGASKGDKPQKPRPRDSGRGGWVQRWRWTRKHR
jgi:hypothetical protein